MKMIETTDSETPASSNDLWAGICQFPTETHQENLTQAFSDSFVCPYPEERKIQDASLHETECSVHHFIPKPWAPLQDSELYLASLERRLQKIKGQSREVTSKDMLQSLGQAKKECWDRFLQESFESEAYIEGIDGDNSTLEHLKRWLQPEKVAINAEEVQCLIPVDSPATTVENNKTNDSAED
ncbi:coiled-coil domain-containing protein 32 [Spea bombifrons]|uniref:coiled-coil domain-containing protein 32 n=1 Tax=Spea bombifrons TaxID=233779 RepID=UPI00234B9879|nr:coiled-coil domain-containing protein 32 [Spea bombifrons]